MLFNSLDFAIFLPIVFIFYWFAAKGNLRLQNILLLISSYFFYASWDWRFLSLLIFSTVLDYYTGLRIASAKNQKDKKHWLWLSIWVNLEFLCIFKYYNFFTESFADALATLGLQINPWTLDILLPLGISFYTFHGLSYVIDIYNNRIKPEKNFISYSLFVSFFPLLIAGPIERATHLLPQILKDRVFNYAQAVDGLRQILWWLFKKIVIADNCAEYANLIFNNSTDYSGSTLILGALFFAFQIYCDFSGYSDIAIGTARLFGINLLRNFAFPYFSRDIAEFWRRWYISLSSWFRDYVYIPLGWSRWSLLLRVRNIFIIFLISGFWHGANWTFIIWGLLNAIYILPSIIRNTNRSHLDIVAKGKVFPTIKEFLEMITTFTLVLFAWIFFRASSVHHAIDYISEIASLSTFSYPEVFPQYLLLLLFIFMLIEWKWREWEYAISHLFWDKTRFFRWTFYLCICMTIFLFQGKQQEFIYFQF